MDPTWVGVLAIIGFGALLALGVHIAISFLIVGLASSVVLIGLSPALSLLGETMYYSIAVPSFTALPLFILMGAFAVRSGFASKAFDAVYKIAARLPGSLAIATCFGSALFGTVSGSSLATAAIFGRVALPEMEKYNYKKSLATGCIAAAGTFASMIPPSLLFIVYAIFTDQSVGKLFMAGIIPGIITAVAYVLSIIIRVRRSPELAPMVIPEKRITWKVKLIALGQMWSIALLALLVLGGIYTGMFSPTEAGAAGAIAALILGLLQGKIRSFSVLKEALRESAQTTAMIFIIIIGALYFSRILALTGVPAQLAVLLQGWDVPRVIVLISILGVWFLLGMIIISTGVFALTLPVIFPIILSLGYNPIWFGVIALKLCEIAAVTPPVGLNVYALKGVAEGTKIEEIFAGIAPFVVVDIIVLAFLIALPQISLFLPNLMLGS